MSSSHFAGINRVEMAEAAIGHPILVSYADFQESPSIWEMLRPRIERGDFTSVILDSGAFTELSQQALIDQGKRTKPAIKISLVDYTAFVVAWVTYRLIAMGA